MRVHSVSAVFLIVVISAAWAGEDSAYKLFSRPALTPVLPDAIFAAGEAETAALKVSAAPGEFEPVGLSVNAVRAVKGLRLSVSDLKGPGGAAIPASAVRVQQVVPGKVTVGPKDKKREVIIPEWVMPPAEGAGAELPAGRTATFLLTVNVPADAAAGAYTGAVTVESEGGPARKVSLEVAVRPFKLSTPKVAFAMLYTYEFRYLERYDPQYEPADKRRPPAEKAAFVARGKAVVRDMAEHGMTAIFPHCSRVLLRKDGKLSMPDLEMSLKTAREHGMTATPGWTVGWLVNAQWADIPKFDEKRDTEYLREIASSAAAAAKAAGFEGIMILPSDEPTVEKKLAVARKLLPALKGIEGVRAATTANYATFKDLSDLTNIAIFAGGTPQEWAEIKAAGREVWIYDNNSACGHNPAWSRFVFGFYGWRADFDGISAWTYPLNIGDYGGRKRLDADGAAIPEYDASGRPINTVTWEGIREGTDDRRYVDTLIDTIAAARQKGLKLPADDAQKLLDDLRASIPPALADYGYQHTEYGDPAPGKFDAAWFEGTREKIAAAILILRAEMHAGK